MRTATASRLIEESRLLGRIAGYAATVGPSDAAAFTSITETYAHGQVVDNIRKTDDFIVPLLRRLRARTVLDAGCGVGATVERLRDHGFDAYGFDLVENVRFWRNLGRTPERYVVAAPVDPVLPFDDGTFDAIYSIGVIEHVGTTDGNATRRRDYHEVRRRWVRELLRIVRPGGAILLAGPNRRFPVDTAHGADAGAWPIEKAFSRRFGFTLHRPWGDNFLWSYDDVERYLGGEAASVEALGVERLMFFTRVPAPLRLLARTYVRHLPPSLLKTAFNPWVAALITKRGRE